MVIPFRVKRINDWFKIHLFVNDMESEPIENGLETKAFGSVWDKISHHFYFRKPFKFGYLDDKKGLVPKSFSIFTASVSRTLKQFFSKHRS